MEDFEYIKNWTIEDDYVERNGGCDELTVTITLREYRSLIKTDAMNEDIIERLTNENSKLKKQVQEYGKALLAKHPEEMQRVVAGVKEILGIEPDEDEEDEAADACPLTGCDTDEAAPEIKCPCDVSKHKTSAECRGSNCDECCPLRKVEADPS